MNKNKSVKVLTAIFEGMSPGGCSDFDLWTEEKIAEALYDALTDSGIRLEDTNE